VKNENFEKKTLWVKLFSKTKPKPKIFAAIKTQKQLEDTTDSHDIHYKTQPKGQFHFGS
jgi:hypothetical protein